MTPFKEALRRFRSHVETGDNALYQSLARRQSPQAMMVSCADSRIQPNEMTAAKPGDLFVLRNAGNIVPPYSETASGDIATIELAAAEFGIEDYIVLGHSDCGAMKLLFDEETMSKLPAMKAWLSYAMPAKEAVLNRSPELSGDALIWETVKENVLLQMEHLKGYPAIQKLMNQGKARIHGWITVIETGETFYYEPNEKDFILMN